METVRLVLKGGTLRLAEKGEFTRKTWGKKKDDESVDDKEIDVWFYTVRTIDNAFEVVDLDKTSAMPLARSILGQIGLYPELKIVKMSRNVLIVTFLLLLLVYMRTWDGLKATDFTKDKKEILDKIQNACIVSKNPFGSGSIMPDIKKEIDTKSTETPKSPLINMFPWSKK